MEKTISQEERIRRAEEIYNRRRIAKGVRVSGNSVNRAEPNKISLFKKTLFQIAICATIYIIFYLVKNGNYIFSEEVLNKTKEFLSYDINFGNIQSQITMFIENNKHKLWETTSNNEISNEIEINSINNETNETIENEQISNIVGGIGGPVTNEAIEESSKEKITEDKKEEKDETENNTEKKSQNELDIEYIKENYKFILPVTGTVTSRYGQREETEVVSANHKGIDIGALSGTPIYASISGTVTVSSEEGEYGKHLDITNGDILTRYAHCSKLLVKEGDKVKQGDKIAEVGSTGNSTGPHLHFEIRRDNRTINPEDILKFD